ncbi:MAG: UDP-glucose 4-epimerase GalE [Chlamydiae bacterium RIFCSPHIGHO2_12_FULL_27_8]|nr:MAG: UDP-glucose 4-epimerase GalE [Chlamydiae bacterium RIFCSPHIGHO2_12_FULL_27_8]OGN66203.1 MAG: UDP-glucose 4-epimerase GalE [Chlamydiae bacterium RIFCSPLOWO2_01_FULL_28_7]
MKKAVFVTGGAGYIGSHNCKELFKNGFLPITFDNLSESTKESVKWGPLIEGDINDSDKLNFYLNKYKPIALMHFAANALVGESFIAPNKYYKNNVAGTINVLDAMLNNNVKNLIFSSSCATYGNPIFTPITENHPQNPISIYGQTKFFVEQILKDYKRAYNLNYASLRYFNAAGADLDSEIGENRKIETHLIPLAIETALKFNDKLDVYGKNFNTKDGSAIRDYVHVSDIAIAHKKALESILENNDCISLNLGSSKGFSVLEVLKEIENELNTKININFTDKREGDPPILFADCMLAKKVLDWEPKLSDLKTIIKSAVRWHKIKKR